MDSHYMQQMFDRGGALIIIGMPQKTEFGIDLETWKIGPKFKGIKMIPPGLHFIYFSAVGKYGDASPRTGFFHWFNEGDVIVKNYNTLQEDLFDEENIETVERIKLNLRDLDGNLGPYPFDSWSKWISFTQYIDKFNLNRLKPKSGKIRSVPELVNIDSVAAAAPSTCEKDSSSQMQQEEQLSTSTKEATTTPLKNTRNFTVDAEGLPYMVPLPGTQIQFSEFPHKPHKEGATPSEVSKGNMDSSFTLDYIFKQLDKPESILAELQFSFVCFLGGHVYDSFEHWRRLVAALCNAEETLVQKPSLYLNFLSILHHQIQEVPSELFADIVENSNFIVISLRTLFANIADNITVLPDDLVLKANKFQSHLTTKFNWNLVLEEDDEDKPVVVEL